MELDWVDRIQILPQMLIYSLINHAFATQNNVYSRSIQLDVEVSEYVGRSWAAHAIRTCNCV